MAKPRVSIIVAASDNHVIGNLGTLPWSMPADLQHFKKLTMGHSLIMGRKTYESIGKPLPGRSTIVLSRTLSKISLPEEVYLTDDLNEAIELANKIPDRKQDQVFITGGGEIYRLSLPIARRIYLTRVHTKVDGDAYFPVIDLASWDLISEEYRQADERNEYACSFEVYERRSE